ncbi:MAG TPA: hypothetical protein VGG37_03325 [Opitutaceae bacterium]|jgi:hypothetical protein
MKKRRVPIFLIAAVLAPALLAADEPAAEPTPTPGPDAAKVILAPRKDSTPAPAADSDGVTRTVSPGIAAALAAGMPRYSPPTPTPTPPPETDADKPKNGIIRLPAYLVREKKPPIFRPRDLYTPTGLIDLTFRAHPGLIFGNLLGLNSGSAYQIYLEEQRQANMSDLKDTAHAMAQGGDFAEGSFILRQSDSTYMRGGTGSWDWDGSGPVGIK